MSVSGTVTLSGLTYTAVKAETVCHKNNEILAASQVILSATIFVLILVSIFK